MSKTHKLRLVVDVRRTSPDEPKELLPDSVDETRAWSESDRKKRRVFWSQVRSQSRTPSRISSIPDAELKVRESVPARVLSKAHRSDSPLRSVEIRIAQYGSMILDVEWDGAELVAVVLRWLLECLSDEFDADFVALLPEEFGQPQGMAGTLLALILGGLPRHPWAALGMLLGLVGLLLCYVAAHIRLELIDKRNALITQLEASKANDPETPWKLAFQHLTARPCESSPPPMLPPKPVSISGVPSLCQSLARGLASGTLELVSRSPSNGRENANSGGRTTVPAVASNSDDGATRKEDE